MVARPQFARQVQPLPQVHLLSAAEPEEREAAAAGVHDACAGLDVDPAAVELCAGIAVRRGAWMCATLDHSDLLHFSLWQVAFGGSPVLGELRLLQPLQPLESGGGHRRLQHGGGHMQPAIEHVEYRASNEAQARQMHARQQQERCAAAGVTCPRLATGHHGRRLAAADLPPGATAGRIAALEAQLRGQAETIEALRAELRACAAAARPEE